MASKEIADVTGLSPEGIGLLPDVGCQERDKAQGPYPLPDLGHADMEDDAWVRVDEAKWCLVRLQ